MKFRVPVEVPVLAAVAYLRRTPEGGWERGWKHRRVGTADGAVILDIDLERLALDLGGRARASTRGRASARHGAIKATVEGTAPLGPMEYAAGCSKCEVCGEVRDEQGCVSPLCRRAAEAVRP